MLKFFVLLVQLALLVFEYLERQRIVTEAERDLLRKLQDRFDKLVERANAAARDVSADPADVLRDPANRDEWKPVVVAGTRAGPDDKGGNV